MDLSNALIYGDRLRCGSTEIANAKLGFSTLKSGIAWVKNVRLLQVLIVLIVIGITLTEFYLFNKLLIEGNNFYFLLILSFVSLILSSTCWPSSKFRLIFLLLLSCFCISKGFCSANTNSWNSLFQLPCYIVLTCKKCVTIYWLKFWLSNAYPKPH